MNNFLKKFTVFALLAISSAAFAQDGAIPILQKGLSQSLDKVFAQLQSVAVTWLGLFILVQFIFTNIQLIIREADIDVGKVFSKLMGSLFWFGICIYIFDNGSDFIKNVGGYIIRQATGSTGVSFDPVEPIHKGIEITSTLLATVDKTQSVLQSLNPFPAIMMGVISIVILAVAALLAFKILMVFIETKMIIALSPLSFSLLGLNAFRDQGLAPLKYLVSMAIRMFLYGAVLSAMGIFSEALIAQFKALPSSNSSSIWPPIWAAAMGFAALGAVALRVDHVAAVLASGSSQISTGDAVAAGAAAGAAAGLAMSSTSSIASAVANPAKTIADTLQKMAAGGGAGVSNAGRSGSGGVDTGLWKPDVSSSMAQHASPPKPPPEPFELGKHGQPLRQKQEKTDGEKSASASEKIDFSGNQESQKTNTNPGSNGSSGNQNGKPKWNSTEFGGNAGSASIGGSGTRQNSHSETPRKEPRHDNDNRPKRSAGDHLEKLNRNIIENAGPIQVQMNTRFDID
ncbi:MAG: hypothetical protein PHV02_08140 [Rhodocyclaceae bacterium]|nr:hypothetical protein [Rhodocyclaceae bacterium]